MESDNEVLRKRLMEWEQQNINVDNQQLWDRLSPAIASTRPALKYVLLAAAVFVCIAVISVGLYWFSVFSKPVNYANMRSRRPSFSAKTVEPRIERQTQIGNQSSPTAKVAQPGINMVVAHKQEGFNTATRNIKTKKNQPVALDATQLDDKDCYNIALQ